MKNKITVCCVFFGTFICCGICADKPLQPIQHESEVSKICEIAQKNEQKFAVIRELNLPIGHYAITGSGALGIRNLREIGDIDIIVTPELWNTLAIQYGVIDKDGVKKIVFPGDIVEAFHEGSFYTAPNDPGAPTVADRIAQAEIIEELPFESLNYVVYYKRKMGRDKDLQDILLIEHYLKSKS